MSWSPISRDAVAVEIQAGVARLTADQREAWLRVRQPLEKWRLSPEGDDGGGFWVAGLDGDRVIWFNDIESGFEVSPFAERGVIGEYRCDQFELPHVIQQLIES